VKPNGRDPGREKVGVLLAMADFPMLVTGYRAVVDAESDMCVVGEAGAGEELRSAIERTAADVAIVECQPYGVDGVVTYRMLDSLKSTMPSVRILALESRCVSEQFSLALRSGADGYLTRTAQPTDVTSAVRAVSRGQTYVSPAIVTRMIDTYVLRGQDGHVEDVWDSLSEQDRELLRLAAVGRTNREIARELHVTEQTVHNHRASVMEKLGFHDRVELLKYAIKRGVIEVADL
jgi:two-component system, NarL family, response regulator NreC